MPELLESEAPAAVQVRPAAVAPWPHTLFLLAILALWASYGVRFSPASMASGMPLSLMYIGQMSMMYLLTGTTIAGLYHRRQFIEGVFGSFSARNILDDVASGFLVYLGGMGVALVLGLVLLPTHLIHKRAVVSALAPRRGVELPLWILVSLTAGLCEEFIFRGYLLQQIRRWFGSASLAVGISALMFGCMHFYEGSAAVVQICGLGAFYGMVAVRRGNLRHVMIAHFFQDALTGLFLYLRH
jgi:membrane protease YdiL (CAAX protease family)